MKGYVHVYTGSGKGKTTAAFGAAMRAAGAGMKIFIGQFVKGKPYAENELISKYLPMIDLKQYGLGCFIVNKPTKNDIDAAREGLRKISGIINSGEYDMVILDEACIALHYNLFTIKELLGIIDSRPGNVEIIITGRYAPAELVKSADLVTEMKEIKHYYQKGIEAREGIEF